MKAISWIPHKAPVWAHATSQVNLLYTLPHMSWAKELSLALILTPFIFILFFRPAANLHALSQNWHELPVGCCGSNCVNQHAIVYCHEIFYDLHVRLWTRLQILEIWSGWKMSETDVEFCFWSARFKMECSILWCFKCLTYRRRSLFAKLIDFTSLSLKFQELRKVF